MSVIDNLDLPSSSISGTFSRFHSKGRFFSSPAQFYRNFLWTTPLFKSRGRFAPANSHCGFYSGSSESVASAEALFYADPSVDSLPQAAPSEVLEVYGAAARREKVFIEVNVELDNVVDLTDWQNVRALFDCGLLRWSGSAPDLQAQYLACLISPERGASALTDAAGWALYKRGFSAVRFPSVRALISGGDSPVPGGIRQHLHDILNMSAAETAMDLGWQAVEQMHAEYDVVVFSDYDLVASIRSYSWRDASGRGATILPNSSFAKTERELEEARLEERARLGLPAPGVAETREALREVLSTGLLSDAERAGEFYCNTAFIRDTR